MEEPENKVALAHADRSKKGNKCEGKRMRVINMVKTTTLSSAFVFLLIPYLICAYPVIVNADYASLGRGTSMTPTIQDGDLVATTKVGPDDIEVGDILAVSIGELKIVHRLVEKLDGERFRLKGDGNERPDQILYDSSQIMGKVIAVYPLCDIYTPSYGYASLLVAGVLLAFSLWKRPNVDLNDVLLCLIISLSMGGIIRLRGGT